MIKRLLGMPLIQTILLAALILAGMLWRVPPLALVENGHYDFWTGRFRAPDQADIAIVAIDEASLARTGDWPWPRSQVAELVQRLSAAGAEALGICLLYAHPELNPGREEIVNLKANLADQKFKGGRKTEQVLERLLDQASGNLDYDSRLITAIRRARNTVLPFLFSYASEDGASDLEPSGLMVINSLRTPAAAPARSSA